MHLVDVSVGHMGSSSIVGGGIPIGTGLGLSFAKELYKRTGVPVGLVPCAHGGTSMAQWDPAKKELAGRSLYGSMLRRFRAVCGKVKVVLWYQGESDANHKAHEAFPNKLERLIASVRNDFGDTLSDSLYGGEFPGLHQRAEVFHETFHSPGGVVECPGLEWVCSLQLQERAHFFQNRCYRFLVHRVAAVSPVSQKHHNYGTKSTEWPGSGARST